MNTGRRIRLLWTSSLACFSVLFKPRYFKNVRTAGVWGWIILVVTSLIPQLGHAALTFGINKTCGGILGSAVSPGKIYVNSVEEAISALQSLTLEAAAVVLVDYEYSIHHPGGTVFYTVRHTAAPTLDGMCRGNSSVNHHVCDGVSNCSGYECAAQRPYIFTET